MEDFPNFFQLELYHNSVLGLCQHLQGVRQVKDFLVRHQVAFVDQSAIRQAQVDIDVHRVQLNQLRAKQAQQHGFEVLVHNSLRVHNFDQTGVQVELEWVY